MTFDEEEEKVRRFEYEAEIAKKAITKMLMSKQEENLEKIVKQQKAARTKESNEVYRDKHKDILDNKSQPIRQYLQDNLVPYLAEGLHDICKNQPDDPVDSLAEYLFKRSLDVQYPDPTTY